jgi:UTP--glucose-1-phosphate uridylyltransferase
MLDALIGGGVKYLFVSNSDNLGATLDLQLLQHFAASGAPFMMEVCERTAADKKGGHLARRKSDGAARHVGGEGGGAGAGAKSGVRPASSPLRPRRPCARPGAPPRLAGKLMLRESAMCPDADKAAFEDITRHKFFNTNNLWVNLPALKVCALGAGPRWTQLHAAVARLQAAVAAAATPAPPRSRRARP